MAVRVPRQDRGQLRRSALISAAVDVLTEQGPAGFSARAVATQAQLPLGAVSYYFPVLEDLLGESLATLLGGWLIEGEAAAAAAAGSGISDAAAAITNALLPADGPDSIRNRYEHLLAASRNPVAATALAQFRPRLESVIEQILRTAGVSSRLSPNVLLAIVDGTAVGAISEGHDDPAASVETMLREVLQANR